MRTRSTRPKPKARSVSQMSSRERSQLHKLSSKQRAYDSAKERSENLARERNREVKRLLANGFTPTELGNALGLGRARIAQIAKG